MIEDPVTKFRLEGKDIDLRGKTSGKMKCKAA